MRLHIKQLEKYFCLRCNNDILVKLEKVSYFWGGREKTNMAKG